MSPDELLRRLAQTLKQEIGPAVLEAYPKTQAFMASVVLEKLARQLELAPAHAAAEAADAAALVVDLTALLANSAPTGVAAAIAGLTSAPNSSGLNALVEALYAARGELGVERFEQALGRVRQTLRAAVDRQMVYAA
jgi:hypothetical protein